MIRVLAALVFLWAGSAMAAVVPPVTGVQDPADLTGTLNRIINNINSILSPLTGGPLAPISGGSSFSLSQPTAGSPLVIGVAPGGATNTSIQIKPNGTGDLIFFSASGTPGNFKFANSASFKPATGFAACPGVIPGKAPIGVQGTVQNYLIVKDWLGRSHGWATC